MMAMIKKILYDFKRTPKKYTTVIGGSLLLCSIGTIGIIGSMSPYYMSYLRIHNQDNSIKYSLANYLNFIQSACLASSATVGGLVKYRYKIRVKKLAVVGAMLHSLALFLCFFSLKSSFTVFSLTLGALYGETLLIFLKYIKIIL